MRITFPLGLRKWGISETKTNGDSGPVTPCSGAV